MSNFFDPFLAFSKDYISKRQKWQREGLKRSKQLDRYYKKMMELYGPMMYRAAFKILRSNEDAEEIVQDTLLKLYKNNTVPDINDKLAAAKLTVAVKNMALNYALKLGKLKTVSYEELIRLSAENDNGLFDTYSVVEKVALQQCTEKLSPLQREYIQLRYVHDFNIKEIAKLKGKSEKSVYATLERALARLRAMMSE